MVKLILDAKSVKLVETTQGIYLKTTNIYKYKVCRLDTTKYLYMKCVKDDGKIREIHLDVDDKFYRLKKLYKFDKQFVDIYLQAKNPGDVPVFIKI